MTEENKPINLPADHDARMERTLLSLDGLSVGDSFGDQFFTDPKIVQGRVAGRHDPPAPWRITDDSVMAISIARCLRDDGQIDRNKLAMMFAREYIKDTGRGYGGTAHSILCAIHERIPWEVAAGSAFDGQGSCGNGGAMRSALIGAYYADDLGKVVEQAKYSAEVTHAHPDGQAGAIAVALAAAWAVRSPKTNTVTRAYDVVEFVLDLVPSGDTRKGIEKVLGVPLNVSSITAVSALGNGCKVISSDTVPYCLWCVAKHWRNYADALWTTVSGFGDRDTTCAIVGGIVALSAGRDSIPLNWIKNREPLSF